MNRAVRATRFAVAATAALLVTGVTYLALCTCAGMYLPSLPSSLLALAGAVLPGYLVNRGLTRSYQGLEAGASEWGSIFGVLLIANGLLLPGLWSGLLGTGPAVASQEALDRTAHQLGLLDAPSARTVQTFPVSRMDTGVLWVPNLGTAEQPRVIARGADGALKVMELGPRGEALEAHSEVLVGPVDTARKEVMLCPVPDEGRTREVHVEWSGGVAHFLFAPGLRQARFHDR